MAVQPRSSLAQRSFSRGPAGCGFAR